LLNHHLDFDLFFFTHSVGEPDSLLYARYQISLTYPVKKRLNIASRFSAYESVGCCLHVKVFECHDYLCILYFIPQLGVAQVTLSASSGITISCPHFWHGILSIMAFAADCGGGGC
jgi:hypothetical protein